MKRTKKARNEVVAARATDKFPTVNIVRIKGAIRILQPLEQNKIRSKELLFCVLLDICSRFTLFKVTPGIYLDQERPILTRNGEVLKNP